MTKHRGLDEGEGHRTGGASAAWPPPSSGRVLVIDDDPMLARVIAELLLDAHEVEVATGGKEAIDRILSGGRYDVIFCDVSMPGIHGLDVHAEVARARPDQAARFVFMSGGVSDPVLRSRLEALPNLLVEKPCAGHRIQEIVTERVRARRPEAPHPRRTDSGRWARDRDDPSRL